MSHQETKHSGGGTFTTPTCENHNITTVTTTPEAAPPAPSIYRRTSSKKRLSSSLSLRKPLKKLTLHPYLSSDSTSSLPHRCRHSSDPANVGAPPVNSPAGANNAGAPLAKFLGSPFFFAALPSQSAKRLSPSTSSPDSLPLPPPLRRSGSDPINSPGVGAPSPAKGSLPPLPPPLYRTVSDPSSAYYIPPPTVVATTTPPRPPSARRILQSPPSAEATGDTAPSPNSIINGGGHSSTSKKLQRMKSVIMEMGKWCDQFMRESQEEEEEMEDEDEEQSQEAEEAVSVERTGECLTIRFKCSCGKSYHILLSGSNCYYKLI